MTNRLAPFALALTATLLTGTVNAVDVPVAGNRMRLNDSTHPQGRRNTIGILDSAVSLAMADPTVTGATASIGRVGDGSVTVLDLPASGWSRTGNTARIDFKFKSRTGPVTSARLVDGRTLRFSAHGAGAYGLGGTLQGAVGVVVEIGSVRFCGLFGGTIARDDGGTFLARRAPAPATCPVLGSTTTTSTTTTTTESTTTSTTTTTTTSTSTTSTTLSICGVRGGGPGPGNNEYAALFSTTREICQAACDANASCQCIVWADVATICSLHTSPCSDFYTSDPPALLYYDKFCPVAG